MHYLTKFIISLIALSSLPSVPPAEAVDVFKENSKAIVVVTAYNKKGQPLTEGTGFIASADGAVVTNYHVIGIAHDIKVRSGRRPLNVTGVIYADKVNDLIILKVKEKGLPAVTPGDAEKMRPGEPVFILSASEKADTERHEGTFIGTKTMSGGRRALKIIAPVSHGSSGSPVFDGDGKVIGIVTFLIKRTQNILLAMPEDLIKEKIKRKTVVLSKYEAIRTYKKTPQYWFYLGYFLLEAGAHKEAIDVLKEAVKIKPDFADAYYYLGVAYEKSGKDTEAGDAYRRTVKAAPDFTDAYFSLGMIYGRMGKYRDAADALRSAVRLEPDYADARYNLGLAYLLLRDRASALEEYRVLKGISPALADRLFKAM
jgi:TolA-binding protein